MKVLVLYEDTTESLAAMRLSDNLNRIGAMLANATVSDDGRKLHINAGTQWQVEATFAPFEALPKARPVQPKPRKGQRRLIFDDEE